MKVITKRYINKFFFIFLLYKKLRFNLVILYNINNYLFILSKLKISFYYKEILSSILILNI